MDSVFVDAKWQGDMSLSKEALSEIKKRKAKKIALFSSVNFLQNDCVKKQLADEGYAVLITKAKRTCKDCQILGCDSYGDSFEEDIILEADILLYVGDGMFHPEALLFSQMYRGLNKEVLCWNPVEQKITILDSKKIETRRKKLKANILRFLNAKTVGILVALKPGQQYLILADALKAKLSEQGKKAYIFVDDTFEYRRMEDYNFVDVWVNTACPRIGQDDITTMPKPLINVREALQPEKYLEKL